MSRVLLWPLQCYRSGMTTPQIRAATEYDASAIAAVHRAAFPAEECETIATLSARLLSEVTEPPTLNYVATIDERVIGHVAYSPLTLAQQPDWSGYLLSPVGVDPSLQAAGIGSALIRRGLEDLARQRVQWVFVYGDPAYYGRFGFDAALAESFVTPHPLAMPFGWQALPLVDHGTETAGQLGCVAALDDAGLW